METEKDRDFQLRLKVGQTVNVDTGSKKTSYEATVEFWDGVALVHSVPGSKSRTLYVGEPGWKEFVQRGTIKK